MIRTGLLLAAIIILIGGCGGMSPSVFIHDEYNFQYLERVAVVPFDNLSSDQGAGARASRIFISELLSERAFDVVEPGEVTKALEKYATVRTSQLTKEQIINIGKELKVQGIILGNVTEVSTFRSGASTTNTVTMVVSMVETETGMTVWSATNTSGKKGFFSSLFGTGDKSESEAMRDCVKGTLKTLIK
ncbi:MAG: hypothetical protein CVT49_00660 [candidate division Zixibacteria bacterium HGW-Zixibacteria-1]|nr:MAG: hypothetical protein CVT49_00660 [candidate division Zixibacteria bacterium HGW-Zixibacteria-1]